MKEELASARKHPAALASIVIASLAVTALAAVTIAYLLGWAPAHTAAPPSPVGMAIPGQQMTGTMEGGVALLPGETLVEPPQTPPHSPPVGEPPPSAPRQATPGAPKPEPAKPAPSKTAAGKAPPIYSQPAPPPPSHAQALPSRAAPYRPNYTREEISPNSFERSSRTYCVNCAVIDSIASAGPDWEVRVRFEDGTRETLRYAERPRLRVGERVHLEDGRLVRE